MTRVALYINTRERQRFGTKDRACKKTSGPDS
jgi:hypothetical protein